MKLQDGEPENKEKLPEKQFGKAKEKFYCLQIHTR